MRKTLAAIFAGLVLATTSAAAQADPAAPDLPPCAALLQNHQATSWPAFETQCGVSFAGPERLYVNLLEYLIDGLQHISATSSARATEQASTIERQQQKIAHQAKVIKRLRHRLATR
jgi:hypothetical protein